MKIKKTGIPSYELYNSNYNNNVSIVTNEILQTEDLGKIGYISSEGYNPTVTDWQPGELIDIVKEEVTMPEGYELKMPMEDMGEYERIVLSCLLWGGFTNYIISGEMGSGKTALVEHITKKILNISIISNGEKTFKPILIEFDFIKGFGFSDPEKIIRHFHTKLLSKIRQKVRRLFIKEKLSSKFMEYVSENNNGDEISKFDSLLENIEDRPKWDKLPELNKTKEIFAFIDNDVQGNYRRIELLMGLIKFYVEDIMKFKSGVIFVFDNLDRIETEAQYDVAFDIIALQEISKSRSLIVLRRSTFELVNPQLAYTFGFINHNGPKPITVIVSRLKHFIKNIKSYPPAIVLSSNHVNALKKRVKYVLNSSSKKNEALDIINRLSGASIRIGLYASNRIFINNSIKFDFNPDHRDDIVRVIYIGGDNKHEIGMKDECVANLFMDSMKGTFSLLNLRILQYIIAFKDDPDLRRTISLSISLKKTGNWTGQQIRYALNYLLVERRPLLWVDGRCEFRSIHSMQSCDRVIHISDMGYNYVKYLLKDFVYIQESLTSLHWPRGIVPIEFNYGDISDRFEILYKCINYLMDEDINECKKFIKWIEDKSRYHSLHFELISNYILYHTCFSLFRILKSIASKTPHPIILEQLRNWKSLVTVGINNAIEINGITQSLSKLNRKLTQLINKMS